MYEHLRPIASVRVSGSGFCFLISGLIKTHVSAVTSGGHREIHPRARVLYDFVTFGRIGVGG
jgi:hypothetical protein